MSEPVRYGAAHGFAGYTLLEVGATFGDVMAGQLARDLIAARDEASAWKRKALATQSQIDRDDSIAAGMSTAELVDELRRMREKRDELARQLDAYRTVFWRDATPPTKED